MKLNVGKLCPLHRSGVPPKYPPFYCKGCEMCESKLARGLVTGLEPEPGLMRGIWWRNTKVGKGGSARDRMSKL